MAKSTRRLKKINSSRRSTVSDGGTRPSGRHSIESEARRMSMHASADKSILDRLRAHYRECRRKDIDVAADVEIYLSDGTFFDKGSAKVTNVSASGALLTEVRIKGESFPTGQFTMRVTMRGGEYGGVTIKCQPVRLVPDRLGIGVRLDDIFVSLSEAGSDK